jgi:hypothetical protein
VRRDSFPHHVQGSPWPGVAFGGKPSARLSRVTAATPRDRTRAAPANKGASDGWPALRRDSEQPLARRTSAPPGATRLEAQPVRSKRRVRLHPNTSPAGSLCKRGTPPRAAPQQHHGSKNRRASPCLALISSVSRSLTAREEDARRRRLDRSRRGRWRPTGWRAGPADSCQ